LVEERPTDKWALETLVKMASELTKKTTTASQLLAVRSLLV
jgi:hypothetical protein